MTQETKLARYRAKQKKAGITRFSVQLNSEAVSLLRNLCQKHRKTQGEFLGLAIVAADALLAGRLQVAKAVAQSAPRVIIQQRAVAPKQPTGNTNTPTTPENAPPPPLHLPEQADNDNVDARIRAAAFIAEP